MPCIFSRSTYYIPSTESQARDCDRRLGALHERALFLKSVLGRRVLSAEVPLSCFCQEMPLDVCKDHRANRGQACPSRFWKFSRDSARSPTRQGRMGTAALDRDGGSHHVADHQHKGDRAARIEMQLQHPPGIFRPLSRARAILERQQWGHLSTILRSSSCPTRVTGSVNFALLARGAMPRRWCSSRPVNRRPLGQSVLTLSRSDADSKTSPERYKLHHALCSDRSVFASQTLACGQQNHT